MSKKGNIPWNKGLKNIFISEKAGHWKGGIQKHSCGYILIYSFSHPHKDSRNCVFEHRLIAEKILNRYLTKKEVIHHINDIKNDNRPENLYLFDTDKEHKSYHANLRWNNIKPITKSNLKAEKLKDV